METMRRISYSSAFDKSDSEVENRNNFTKKGDLGFGSGLLPGAVATSTSITTSMTSNSSQKKKSTCTSCSRRDSDSQTGNRIQSSNEEEVFLRANCLICNDSLNTDTGISNCCGDAGLQQKHNLLYRDPNNMNADNGLGDSDFVPRLRSVVRRALNQRKVNGDGSGDIKIDLCSSGDQAHVGLICGSELASQKVTDLQSELEATKRQLNSKYRAIQILQSQAVMINKEHSKSIQEAKCLKISLEQEVNCLQFDLSTTQECSMMSQRTWAERFDRVCSENRALETTLQENVKELKMAQLENLSLKRERDELLAMMDVKERLQYTHHKACYLYDTETYSMVEELAVLGACLCRGSRPGPCGCARVAAGLKRKNHILKYEMDQLRQNLDATRLMADSFRTAFDHQLDQNIVLCEKITSLCQDERRAEKNEDQDLRVPNMSVEDDQESTNYKDGAGNRSIAVQASQPLPDIINTLADLLNDKTEALVHQRLVAKMLARKTKDLEKTMEQLNEYSKVVKDKQGCM